MSLISTDHARPEQQRYYQHPEESKENFHRHSILTSRHYGRLPNGLNPLSLRCLLGRQ